MVNVTLIVGATVLVIGVALVLNVVLLRSRHHFTSRLTCQKCKGTFDYKWVPGASFSAVRLGKERYLRCPLCKEWSTFDVWDTRVTEESPPESK